MTTKDDNFSYAFNMFSGKVGHYIISATGIIAALSWNHTMKEVVKANFPQPEAEIKRNVVYSLLVTLLLILLIWILPTPASVKLQYENQKKQNDSENKTENKTENFMQKKLNEYC